MHAALNEFVRCKNIEQRIHYTVRPLLNFSLLGVVSVGSMYVHTVCTLSGL